MCVKNESFLKCAALLNIRDCSPNKIKKYEKKKKIQNLDQSRKHADSKNEQIKNQKIQIRLIFV